MATKATAPKKAPAKKAAAPAVAKKAVATRAPRAKKPMLGRLIDFVAAARNVVRPKSVTAKITETESAVLKDRAAQCGVTLDTYVAGVIALHVAKPFEDQ